jgi:SAM-dependent methyltransferase
MTDVTERWRTERVMAAMYDAGVKHDRVAMVGAWAMWGADMRRMFADVARLADVPAGTSVLDIPCGGGFAFRVLRPGQPVRYVAADISPYMLQRARKVARRMRTEDVIDFVEADVTALQFADNSFDLCVTVYPTRGPRWVSSLACLSPVGRCGGRHVLRVAVHARMRSSRWLVAPGYSETPHMQARSKRG